MSRGTVEAQTLRTEQFEFEARTSDPADAQPGEYWIRTDQTSTNPDVIAELRRQDNSGVTTCPIFADAEGSNLGADVTRGPPVVLDDGSVGFVAMTTGAGAVGSPRAVNSAGTEYLSHNGLELNPILDSAVFRQLWDEGSGTTVEDVIGTNDGTVADVNQWISNVDFEGESGLSFAQPGYQVTLPNRPFAHSGQKFFGITINNASVGSFAAIYYEDDFNGNVFGVGFDDIGRLSVENLPTYRSWSNPTTALQRIGVYMDFDNPEVRIYSDGDRVDDSNNANAPISGGPGISIGNTTDGDFPLGGEADHPIAYSGVTDPDALAQDDYNIQPFA